MLESVCVVFILSAIFIIIAGVMIATPILIVIALRETWRSRSYLDFGFMVLTSIVAMAFWFGLLSMIISL